jgi:hypothetical protein
MLRISQLASFFAFCSALPIILFWAGATSGEQGQSTRRHLHDFRHIQASWRNPSMRRGGPFVINRHVRFSHCIRCNPSAAAAATQAVRPSRIRIVNEPEATLLHRKDAPCPPASCGLFSESVLDPNNRVATCRPASSGSISLPTVCCPPGALRCRRGELLAQQASWAFNSGPLPPSTPTHDPDSAGRAAPRLARWCTPHCFATAHSRARVTAKSRPSKRPPPRLS